MDISSLFTGVTGYLTGITVDVYTAAAAILACLCIACGVAVLQRLLTGDQGESEGDGAFSEGDFQNYAQSRYKKELYSKTYEKRGIGKSQDMGGDKL